MKNSAPKNISDVLQNSTLTRIVEKANQLSELNRKIQTLLPDSFRGLYRVVNLVDNQLIFNVQSATVRQGLLLQHATLLTRIQAELPEVTALDFRVNPAVTN